MVNGLLLDGRTAAGDIVIPEGVTKICDYAFFDNAAITSVVIPDSAEEIGSCAFHFCNAMTSVDTGNGVKQDQTYAELLMRKARDGGMKEAQDFLDRNFKE